MTLAPPRPTAAPGRHARGHAVAKPVRRQHRPGDELSHGEILEILTGLLAALFTALLSANIVSIALPTIIGKLNGTQTQYTWIVTASLLASTVTTPIWGKLSDLFSKKLLVQLAIVVFVVGSIIAGLSVNVPMLLACRVLQGLGMGGLMALAQSIIGSIIPPRDRGRYSGYMGATMAVATVSGPLIGGVITDTSWMGWRFCFYVCVPLAVISLVILQRKLHLVTIPRRVTIDYAGAILIAITSSLPLVWVSFAGTSFAWLSWQSAAFLIPTIVLAVVLVRVELRAPEPMLPLSVLANRTTTLAIVASLGVGVALFGSAVFLGQYFQTARGYTPTHAGLLTFPLALGSLVASTGAGLIISKSGKWKRFLVIGGVLLTAAMVAMGTVDHHTPITHVMIYMAMMGLGMGMMMQNLVLAVQNTVDVTQVGAASAAVSFFRSLGGVVGVAVLGAVLARRVSTLVASGLVALGPAGVAAAAQMQSGSGSSELDFDTLPAQIATVVRSAYGDATGRIFMIAAAMALISLISVLFIKEVPLRRTVRQEPPHAADETRDKATAGVGTSV
jgi:EmrB/QacA subfamily drug resistance transporter